MELLPDGKMVLDEQDTVGVLALIYAKTRMVVDIHATTDSSLSTCHADPPRTRARAYAESNPLRQSGRATPEYIEPDCAFLKSCPNLCRQLVVDRQYLGL
jgi:hypothetical protein